MLAYWLYMRRTDPDMNLFRFIRSVPKLSILLALANRHLLTSRFLPRRDQIREVRLRPNPRPGDAVQNAIRHQTQSRQNSVTSQTQPQINPDQASNQTEPRKRKNSHDSSQAPSTSSPDLNKTTQHSKNS